MIKIVRVIFRIYHLLFASSTATCRFRPTCSQYALQAIEKYGVVKGSWQATKRVLSCHPFTKRPIFDPV